MWIPVNLILSFLISIEYFYLLHLENKFYKEVAEKEMKEEGQDEKADDEEKENYATSKSVTNLMVQKDDSMTIVKAEEVVKRPFSNKVEVEEKVKEDEKDKENKDDKGNMKNFKSSMHEVKMGKIEPLGSFH